ncbi:MAG: efflux RND transporter permease subunit [Hyphomonadaceae bacterium]|nr:efflux RND transporter permease subunit [Hyphomonadaceae bacterium]
MAPNDPETQGGGLIGWFVRNPVAANLLMVVLLIGGLLMAGNLRSQVFPTIEPGIVTVSVPYPGATPAEVEEGVTRRVEEAVLGIDGVKRVSSVASENIGTVTIELADFADEQIVKDDVQTAVEGLADFPPENAERETVRAPKPTGSVVTLVVVGNVTPMELRLAAERLERELLTQDGISLVSLSGDRDYEISIEVTEDTLQKYGLSIDDVARAVRASSLDLAGGSIQTQSGEYLLRTNQRRLTGEGFESIVVRNLPDGSQILLSDIADIRDGFTREALKNTYNGRPAIFVDVARAEAEDVIAVKAVVDAFMESYSPPEGIEIIEFRDQTGVLEERINLLLRNALFGFALVFLFLVLMLDLKLAFWVCIGIATAFMGGFMLFGAAGVTITMVSLFGLIIVLGLVVDDAIVIGENIDAEIAKGKTGARAAIDGVSGVFSPVLVGVMTTIAAFSPLLFVGGTFGDITQAIPLVVICVLIVSLVEAFFILPSHLSHGRPWSRGPVLAIQGRVAKRIGWVSENIIRKGVRFVGKWRYATLGAATAFYILCMSLMSSGLVKFVFFPSIEGNDISATLVMPEGTPFERTEAAMDRLTEAAFAVAERAKEERGEDLFLSVAETVGGNTAQGGGPVGNSGFSASENVGQVQIELIPFGTRRMSAAEIERAWREELGEIEGAERLTFAASIGGFGEDIEFELAHADEATLIAASDRLKAEIERLPGANQIEDSFDLGKRQLLFELTDAGLAAGLTPTDIARQVRQTFFGEEVQRIQRGREEVRVFVRYPESARQSLQTLDDMRIRLADGSSVPLYTVAETTESRAYSSINRINGRRVVTVTADIDEAISTPAIANEALMTQILPELERTYPGLNWAQAGSSREQTEDLASLGQAFIVVMLIIFALVATQLRSYLQPLAIIVAIPLGVAGAVLGHFVLGYALSFVSIFGIVALSGVAVNASVVLVDLYNQYRKDGMDMISAAADASARRFRPILLTTLTTALGLGPLLLETSPQAQFLIPMGVSLGFGIVISGIMVLFVTPAVTLVIEDLRNLPGHIRSLMQRREELGGPAE